MSIFLKFIVGLLAGWLSAKIKGVAFESTGPVWSLSGKEFHTSHRESEDTLNLPVLEILELRFCADVDSVNLVSPNLDSMSILSSYTITFRCFNVNPIFAVIKHLCLNGTSLEKIGSVRVPDRLRRLLKLQSLQLCDFKISVESIRCAFCLLRNSPNLYKIEID
ncbi:hypothetical protein BC332_22715 [Capsicum chinense]|nr:hypothetical protein BC332_22715 [Capsicum chinense]